MVLKQDYVFASDEKIWQYKRIMQTKIRIPRFAYDDALIKTHQLQTALGITQNPNPAGIYHEFTTAKHSRTVFFIDEDDCGFLGMRGQKKRQLRVLTDVLNLPDMNLPEMVFSEEIPLEERKWLYQKHVDATKDSGITRLFDRTAQKWENYWEYVAQKINEACRELGNREFTQP